MPFKRQLLFVFALLTYTSAFSQDYQEYHYYGKGIGDSTYKSKNLNKTTKLSKNSIRLGLYFTRATVAYDRALSEKWSVGLEGITRTGKFPGFVTSVQGRYYFKGFNRTGFFLEEKLSYGFFSPTVYDSVTTNQYSSIYAWGEHQGSLYYFANTISAGFRVIINDIVFLEFLGGIRGGILRYGGTDNYMYTGGSIANPHTYYTTGDYFKFMGPGYPICLNIRLGFKF